MPEAAPVQKEYKRPGAIRRFVTRFFVTVGVIATFTMVVMMATVVRVADYLPAPLPNKILLTYTFKHGLVEAGGKPSLSQPLLKPPATFHDVVKALDEAQKDSRVKGFIAHLQDATFSVAQVQELRDAIIAFRKSGKFAYIYGDDFGGFSPGMADYYLASAFDQIWLQPVGIVGINGVAAEVPFVRGLLDKVGVLPQFSHKGIYKSAPESLTNTDISQPNREATTDLVNDLFDQMVKGISADRKIPEADLEKDVNGAPYNEKEALALKLVDHVGGYDEFLAAAKKQAGITKEKPVDLLNSYSPPSKDGADRRLPDWLKQYETEKPAPGARKIALIYGVGEIVPYKDSRGTFGEAGMAAEKIVAAFKAAMKDKDVAAIVFRVDSPGGSPQAAEAIRRVMLDARKKGRPVIMSMGGMAASGGYWIATGADEIVAQPATITGSIGVFGGKLVLTPLWAKLGMNWVGIQKGDRARMWSMNAPFSDAEYARFDQLLNDTYEDFLQRVMEARHMTHDQAEAVAEGRVWTGREAKDRGLVDELGGLDLAIQIAEKQAKLDTTKEIPVEEFPEPQSTLEQFVSMMTEGALTTTNISAQTILEQLEQSGKTAARGSLLAPVMEIH